MRGKAIAMLMAAKIGRITPAYAGKRSSSAPASDRSQDHPRICGEKHLR